MQNRLLIFQRLTVEAIWVIWSRKSKHCLHTLLFWKGLKSPVPGGSTSHSPISTQGSVQKLYLYIHQLKSELQVVWPRCKSCQVPDVFCLQLYTYLSEDYPGSGDGSDYPYFFPTSKAIILKLHSLSHKPLSGSCLGHILLLPMKTAESCEIDYKISSGCCRFLICCTVLDEIPFS